MIEKKLKRKKKREKDRKTHSIHHLAQAWIGLT